MRPSIACYNCRVSKRACRPKVGEVGCVRCYSLGLSCTLPRRTAQAISSRAANQKRLLYGAIDPDGHSCAGRKGIAAPNDNPELNGGLTKLNSEFRMEAIKNYFRFVHDKHHSLFHPPSFYKSVEENSALEIITYAMIALGSRFLEIPSLKTDRRTWGDYYSKRAHELLDLRDISLSTLQACILLGTLCFIEGELEAEVVYYASANRLALILDLPNRQYENDIEHQVNLRIWWSLYMIDIWSSNGLQIPRDLDPVEHVGLPTGEELFLSLDYRSRGVCCLKPGIWAEMARLTHIWSEIQSLNKASVNGDLSPSLLYEAVNSLLARLDSWKDNLSPCLTETLDNLRHHASIGYGSTFAALHLGYHYYNQILLYQFLSDNDHGGTFSAKQYAKRCTTHAMAFCNLLDICQDTKNCDCLYVMVGHMLTVTSTVYLYMLLLSGEENCIATARERLPKNFSILIKLQSYWKILDCTLDRFQSFHNACQQSVELSFRMDKWMLRFIMGHGTPIPEKFASIDPAIANSTEHGQQDQSGNLQEWYARTFSDTAM